MSNSIVPFYTQAAILDRYIHSSDPGADPDTLEVILAMLESRKDLRDYFFRSQPHAAWAPILWDHGFFDEPPCPQQTEGMQVLPRWDVQEYLISVASQVPDVVVKHVETIEGAGWYRSRALRALCLVPVDQIVSTVPRIIEWLKDIRIARAIASETCELIGKLADEDRPAAAFSLFRELTLPAPPPEVEVSRSLALGAPEAISRFEGHWDEDQVLASAIEALKRPDDQQVVSILEDALCEALRIEALIGNSPGLEFVSWWRTAIEETGQDLDRSYKQKLLVALRDALEVWVQQEAREVRPLLVRYLGAEHEILRRMGLHILNRCPGLYEDLVSRELLKPENFDSTGIHHEFFLLLERGYPWLEPPQQQLLISSICGGPPPERKERMVAWAREDLAEDSSAYVERYSRVWIRDRLWMLREHLVGPPRQTLDSLVAELGEPERPTFTRWFSDVFSVREISPITEEELARLSSNDLLVFLKGWQPPADRSPGPERISYEGLARDVSAVVVAQPEKYADHLVDIALQRPDFARELLYPLARGEGADILPWELGLGLCERLLAREDVRNDVGGVYELSWVGVRQSMVRLLESGLTNPERAIPAECLPRVRDVLLVLVEDPDPESAGDRPSEGWLGYNDPATVALNRVRPSAVIALIQYARYRMRFVEPEAVTGQPTREPGPQRLEAIVRDALTRKLDRHQDPSWAVHSVFGRSLPLLYWLDQEWVESNIDHIFPEGTDEHSILHFIAAWDSFVAFNGFYTHLWDSLRSKYERAIYNVANGYVTQTGLGPEKYLPVHLIWEYLLSDYDLRSPEGQRSLIATFFRQVSPEARGSGAWALWRVCADNRSAVDDHWARVRGLWEWRAHEAAVSNHSVDFDEEMMWLAHLLDTLPESETIVSMWPLLESLLPHVTRAERRGIGWTSLQKYLAVEVDRDPERAIQFYLLMHQQPTRPMWIHRGEEERKIIETALACPASRDDALSLIDLIARSGDHQYEDLYKRYSR